MKIRRPTTDKEMAVYGNGVFMIRLFRGDAFMFLRVIYFGGIIYNVIRYVIRSVIR